jgi:peptidylprolyl isomerase
MKGICRSGVSRDWSGLTPLLQVMLLVGCVTNPTTPVVKGPTSAEVLAASTASDWREPNPEHTLYLELASGRVIIELAPSFAPKHVVNIEMLAREKYFDGLFIVRAQDNYVVQWGDPEEDPEKQKRIIAAMETLPGEFAHADDVPFTRLADGDVYAPEVGFSDGFPAARDAKAGKAWLAHCYGMLGVGRGNAPDSGGGKELYVVIGHAPRHLDRNITLAGRVIKGIELLSTLPRGTGALGFYEKREQYVPIESIRVAADLPANERTALELLRTDTPTFAAWVQSRRYRHEEWFADPVGRVELCNVPLPARARP